MDGHSVLSRAFLNTHPADAAPILESVPPAEAAALFGEVPVSVAAAVLQHMASSAGAECLAEMPAADGARVVATLAPDFAALLLHRLDPDAQARLVAALPEAVAASLGVLLRYPESTAGALMDPRTLAVPQDVSVGEALVRVRRSAQHVLEYLYVVDRSHVLVGVLDLRELMVAPRSASLTSVMNRNVARLAARDDPAAIVAHTGWREFHALPVVDDADVFLGAIRYRTFRRLERDARRTGEAGAGTAVVALGELCWSGLAHVLVSLGAVVAPRQTHPRHDSSGSHGT